MATQVGPTKDSETVSKKMVNKKLPFYENWRSVLANNGGRMNALCNRNGRLIKQEKAETQNVYDVFLNGLLRNEEAACFGWRAEDHYEFISYKEVDQQLHRTAKALRQITGLNRQDFVGLYSANSPQWMITALACASSSLVLVPLYDTLGADSCCHIINEVEMSVLFVDTVAACSRIFDNLQKLEDGKMPLHTIVLLGAIGKIGQSEAIPEQLAKRAKACKVQIIHTEDFNNMAELVETEEQPGLNEAKMDDLYMVQYTSGTTGVPKGVMLTHGCFVSNVAAVQSMYNNASPKGYRLCECLELTMLHYLPLAHSYGQLLALACIYNCGAAGFFSGNVANLAEDAQLLRPTYMPLVPRLMNKVYSKVLGELDTKGSFASKIFWFAYAKKRQLVQRGIITKSSVWDKLVFGKLQAKLGGQVKFMLTASAPVSAEVLEFWRVVFGAHIFEAYGQTECTALVTVAIHAAGGNVGHPVACNMVKLADVPDMGLSAASGRGEVCVKGENLMKGYFKRPELTAEVIDEDGWMHTGDIGKFSPDGALKLIDRKKHIFKLAQGEYIAPEKIESVYAGCPLVGQIFVDGSGLQWYTVAVVVPEQTEAEQWAVQNGLTNDKATLPSLCQNKHFIRHVITTLNALGREKGLNSLEQIRAVHLHPDLFSVENDLLTPSMKNRRPQLRAFFKSQIDDMYESGPMINKANH